MEEKSSNAISWGYWIHTWSNLGDRPVEGASNTAGHAPETDKYCKRTAPPPQISMILRLILDAKED